MNKLVIPSVLLATVMVAGMFAFMPVEQASTVHDSGAITTAGGGVLDSDEDLTDRIVAGNGDDITITIGTDNNTPFYVHQIIACVDTAADNNGELSIISITVDGDIVERDSGTLSESDLADGNNLQICTNAVGIINDNNSDLFLSSSIASDGGDIVITIDADFAGDTLTSVKVVATVQSGASIEVESALVV